MIMRVITLLRGVLVSMGVFDVSSAIQWRPLAMQVGAQGGGVVMKKGTEVTSNAWRGVPSTMQLQWRQCPFSSLLVPASCQLHLAMQVWSAVAQ
eukprot:scaffold208005_cov21-Tisochrysis_lutea.AAC.3